MFVLIAGGGRTGAALAQMLARLSEIAVEWAPWVSAIDLNPVVAADDGGGARAVDALIVLKDTGAEP